jgi:hypothetical protein
MTTTEAPSSAEIAHAMSECMNLLFLFAAPRVLATVRGSGSGDVDTETSLASLRRFLRYANGIRARAASVTGDIARLVEAAMVVEEIAGVLSAAPSPEGRDLPAAVVDRARRALAILGAVEPAGGWDAFEGFTVSYPPPTPRTAG